VGLIGAIFLCSIANAGVVADAVAGARVALVGQDTERAESLLLQARMSVPNETEILDAALVAELLYLEGLLWRVRGFRRERDVDRFRNALSVFPKLKWAREIVPSKDDRAYFEALRDEILQRDPVPTGVPQARGMLVAFVDGVEHGHMHAVRSGPHVAQVRCPDGAVSGRWTEFSSQLKWLDLCEESVDLGQNPPKTEPDAFALMSTNANAGPEPLVWVEPQRQRRQFKLAPISKRNLWIGASALGAVAIGTYAGAMSARSTYDDLQGPLRNSKALEAQRATTNTLVGASAMSGALSIGLALVATFTGEF
jgi:hypothetical protein